MLAAVNSAAGLVRRQAHRARARACGILRTALIVALVPAAALGLSGPGLAHDINTQVGHEAEDAVVHTAASEVQLDRETRIRSAWASQATNAVAAADPAQVGQWGPVVAWPVVGIHVALLPNGRVLAWDSV